MTSSQEEARLLSVNHTVEMSKSELLLIKAIAEDMYEAMQKGAIPSHRLTPEDIMINPVSLMFLYDRVDKMLGQLK